MNAYFRRKLDSIIHKRMSNLEQCYGELQEKQEYMVAGIESAVADLRNQIAELKAAVDTSEEHVPVMDTSPEPEKTRRYNLTDEQIDAMTKVLEQYADVDNWRQRGMSYYFSLQRGMPWMRAKNALREAGIKK